MHGKFWEFLNSKFGVLLTGFVLGTMLGGWINDKYQLAKWEREKQMEVLGRALTDQKEFFEKLSVLADSRAFRLRKVYWALRDNNKTEYINKLWDDKYYPTVTKWNEQLHANHRVISILTRYADSTIENEFFTEEDDRTFQSPNTVHGYFKNAHYSVRQLACCNISEFCDVAKKELVIDCKNKLDDIDKVDKILVSLENNIGDFLVELQNHFDMSNREIRLKISE